MPPLAPLPPADKALRVASWRSAGAEWAKTFCSGLVREAAEAQLRAIAGYDPPGGTSVDEYLHHVLRPGDFASETRNHRLEQLPGRPHSGVARVHRWLTAAEGDCPLPPQRASQQGFRGIPPPGERHSGVSRQRRCQALRGGARCFLEAPPMYALPTVDHGTQLHDHMGGTHRGCGVGA